MQTDGDGEDMQGTATPEVVFPDEIWIRVVDFVALATKHRWTLVR